MLKFPPVAISEIDDHAFPLFLTARQFFILLDNLKDGNAFFSRDGEDKLAEKIVSSDYDHEDPDTLLDLEESDSEGEVDQDTDFDGEDFVTSQPAAEKKKLPLRREITASYFAEKIWPGIMFRYVTQKSILCLSGWKSSPSLKVPCTQLRKKKDTSVKKSTCPWGRKWLQIMWISDQIYTKFSSYI